MNELISLWGLNLIDFLMIYVLTGALVGFKFTEVVKRFSLKAAGFALGYGILMGTVFSFGGGLNFHAVDLAVNILSVYFISKMLNMKIDFIDATLIYFIFYAVGHIVVIPVFLLIGQFQLPQVMLHYLTYISTLVILSIVCQFIDFNRLFMFISRRFILKLLIFILFAMFVSSFIAFNFQTERMNEYMVLFIILVTIAFNSLYYLFKLANEYMNKLPDKLHDTRNALSLLNSKIRHLNDAEEIKANYAAVMEIMGIEAQEVRPENTNGSKAFILETIASVQQENKSNVEVIHDIDYESSHPVVSDVVIAYLLGILLENAIQTMTHKPIYVDVFSSSRYVAIKVANESKRYEQKYLEDMFKRGRSSKAKVGRGFGLAKLKQVVKKYNGKVSVSQRDNLKENTNYLSVLIRF